MIPKPRQIEDSKRFSEIVSTLTKNGFSYWLNRLKGRKFNVRNPKKPDPVTVRETLEELGPTFVKLGQLIATRPDLVPESYIEELKKLQNDVPEFSGEKARKIVDEEVGLENFSRFNEDPSASASIAQVHEAKLTTGEDVVVKVRRPGVKSQMEADLDILKYFGKKADKHGPFKRGFLENEINEFASHSRDELNFMRELAKINEFRDKTDDQPRIKIPETFPNLSTERVLVLEKMEGVRIDDFDQLDTEVDQNKLVSEGIQMVVRQITGMGVLHGDPHPSNIWVNSEGQIVMLDFGITARLSENEQRYFTEFMYHIGRKDIEKVVETIEKMCYIDEDADIEQFRRVAQREVLDIEYTPESYKTVSASMFNLFMEASNQGIYFPTKMMLIGKAMVTMEGIGLQIEDDYDPKEDLKNAVKNELKDQIDPKETVEEFLLNASQNPEAFTRIPNRLNEFEPSENRSSDDLEDISDEDQSKTLHPLLLLGILGLSSFLIIQSSEPDAAFLVGLTGFIVGIYIAVKNLA